MASVNQVVRRRPQNHYPVETGATESSLGLLWASNHADRQQEYQARRTHRELRRLVSGLARPPAHLLGLAKKPRIKTLTVEGISESTQFADVSAVPDAWRRVICVWPPRSRRASKCLPIDVSTQRELDAFRGDDMTQCGQEIAIAKMLLSRAVQAGNTGLAKTRLGHDCQVVCHASCFAPVCRTCQLVGSSEVWRLGQLLGGSIDTPFVVGTRVRATGRRDPVRLVGDFQRNRQSLLTMEARSTGVTVPATENTSHPAGSLARSSK